MVYDSYCPLFSGANKDRWKYTVWDSAASTDEQSQFFGLFLKSYDWVSLNIVKFGAPNLLHKDISFF